MDTVQHLGNIYEQELDWIEALVAENPKSYQIWHYRRCIIELLGDPSREIDFINRQLDIDSKNYHGWSYRYSHFMLL